jgi:hypothetical protein
MPTGVFPTRTAAKGQVQPVRCASSVLILQGQVFLLPLHPIMVSSSEAPPPLSDSQVVMSSKVLPIHCRHTSHVTRHTSHVTRHTSHVTRHTSHVTRHKSLTLHPRISSPFLFFPTPTPPPTAAAATWRCSTLVLPPRLPPSRRSF